jgi:ATP-dependent Clp protease ATP-binding subunit ClpA
MKLGIFNNRWNRRSAGRSGELPAIDKGLRAELEKLHVSFDCPDLTTVLLRNVPTNQRFFNKLHTNLLVKDLPFAVCCDADLEYLGRDQALARAFASAARHKGWRVLLAGNSAPDAPVKCVNQALAMLGFNGRVPALMPSWNTQQEETRSKLLSVFGRNLTQELVRGSVQPCIGRAEALMHVLSCLLQWQKRLVIVAGGLGAGKTNLLDAIAERLLKVQSTLEVYSVNVGLLMAGTSFDGERERLLARLLDEVSASSHVVLAMEHMEQAISGVPRGPLLLARAVDAGARIIGTCIGADHAVFRKPPLSRRVCVVELEQLSEEETLEALSVFRGRIAAYHGVGIDEALLPIVVQTSTPVMGSFPSKAIALLDAAAARARLSGAQEIRLEDVYIAVGTFQEGAG